MNATAVDQIGSRMRPGLAVILLTVPCTAVLGVLLGSRVPHDERYWIIALIAIIALLPPIWRLASGTFDPFEPIVFTGVAIGLLFVARPLHDLAEGLPPYQGAPIEPSYTKALLLGLLAAIAYQAGYHLPARRAWSTTSFQPNTSVAVLVAIAATITSLVFIVAVAEMRGGLHTLFQSRGGSVPAINTVGVGRVPPIMFPPMILALPAFVLTLSLPRLRPALWLLLMFQAGLIALVAIPGGNRSLMIPALASTIIALYLRRGTRPRLLVITIVGIITLLLVTQPVLAYRSGNGSFSEGFTDSFNSPLRSVGVIVGSMDASPFTAFAAGVDAIDRYVPRRLGADLAVTTLLTPIPDAVWTSKPETTTNLIIDIYWGVDNGVCQTFCPTFTGLLGPYSDFGAFGVGVAGFVLGAISRRMYLLCSPGSSWLGNASYALFAWLAFLFWWGNFEIISIRAIITLVPCLAIVALSHRRRPAASALREAPPERLTSAHARHEGARWPERLRPG